MTEPYGVDPLLPELSLALNATAMATPIAAWLQRLALPFELHACRLERFRYRPGQRLLCLYELQLRDPLSGSSWRHWVSGLMSADGSLDRYYRQGCRAAAQPSGRFPLLAPTLLASPPLLLQSYPADHRLPQLATLFGRLPLPLEQLYRAHFGGLEMAVEHPQPERYRPQLSAVLSQSGYRHREGERQGEPWQVYLKLRADGAAECYQRQRRLCAWGGELGLTPVAPLGYIAALGVQVDSAASGRSLLQHLRDGAGRDIDWCWLGQRLAQFHGSAAPVTERVAAHGRVDRARTTATLLSWACPEQEARLADLLARLDHQATDRCWLPCHGDLKPEHLYIDSERLVVIDLDELCLSDPQWDLALLLARLELIALTEANGLDLGQIARQLLQGYQARGAAQVVTEGGARLGWYYACAALDMARYAVQHQLPQWRALGSHFCVRAAAALQPGWEYGGVAVAPAPCRQVGATLSTEPSFTAALWALRDAPVTVQDSAVLPESVAAMAYTLTPPVEGD